MFFAISRCNKIANIDKTSIGNVKNVYWKFSTLIGEVFAFDDNEA